MILILLGLALWAGAHFWKRISPASRARAGNAGKGIVAAASVIAIVLMVIGYRGADTPVYWGRTAAMTGINNLLVLLAFYLFAAKSAKTAITRRLRHPQLTAVIVWAGAHLLVNGDMASILLFGGMLVWAAAEIVVLNRTEPDWTPAHPVPVKKEVTTAVIAVVAYGVTAAIHIWLGVNPFG